jgi:hypothetical protein
MGRPVMRGLASPLMGVLCRLLFGEQRHPLPLEISVGHRIQWLRAELALAARHGDRPHRQAAFAAHVDDERRAEHDREIVVPADGTLVRKNHVLIRSGRCVAERRW